MRPLLEQSFGCFRICLPNFTSWGTRSKFSLTNVSRPLFQRELCEKMASHRALRIFLIKKLALISGLQVNIWLCCINDLSWNPACIPSVKKRKILARVSFKFICVKCFTGLKKSKSGEWSRFRISSKRTEIMDFWQKNKWALASFRKIIYID